MEQQEWKAVAVVGPTASGKSRLAVELALRLGGEVISADSMQIYRGMSVGTAKPTREEMRGVPHHLIDILDPAETFSVADFQQRAGACIREIASRGRLPVLAGGTGLYLRALLRNTQFAESRSDPGLREELYRLAEEQGPQALWETLRMADPQAAARIHPHNVVRVVRAIEIHRLTGKTMTEQNALSHREPSPYRACWVGLCFSDRAVLYERIGRRVDEMLENGLVEEARALLSHPCAATAAQAIGYKELAPYLRGECTLEQAAEEIKRETRRYAKRQMTWFRREPEIHWLEADGPGGFPALAARAEEWVRRTLALPQGEKRACDEL